MAANFMQIDAGVRGLPVGGENLTKIDLIPALESNKTKEECLPLTHGNELNSPLKFDRCTEITT